MAIFFDKPEPGGELTAQGREKAADRLISTLLDYERNARAARIAMFDPHVINDSGWLLAQDLFAAHLKNEKMRTKELHATSGLPHTTVLRYLDHLEKVGFVRRETDPDDSRATLISLTDAGAFQLREFYRRVIASEKRRAAKGRGLFSIVAASSGIAHA
jgi:DNA-binding HxlR family transcriptional regulator